MVKKRKSLQDHSYAYVVVGSSAAGISALNTISMLNPLARTICITADTQEPYNTCFLVDLISGKKSEKELMLRIVHADAQLRFATTVIAIDREKKFLTLSDNATILYQKLLLATGSCPLPCPIPGVTAANTISFHTLAQAKKIQNYSKTMAMSHVFIVGAGLTGLECADALKSQGIAVTIIEKKRFPLGTMLSPVGGQIIEKYMKQAGIHFVPYQTIDHIHDEDSKNSLVYTADGKYHRTNRIILTTGTRPNTHLAVQAQLSLARERIVVDEHMQTSDEAIWAAGDAIITRSNFLSVASASTTWADAVHQGIIAAHAMAGMPRRYPGILSLIRSRFFGLQFMATGIVDSVDGCESKEYITEGTEYIKIVSAHGITVGFVYLGTSYDTIGALQKSMGNRSLY